MTNPNNKEEQNTNTESTATQHTNTPKDDIVIASLIPAESNNKQNNSNQQTKEDKTASTQSMAWKIFTITLNTLYVISAVASAIWLAATGSVLTLSILAAVIFISAIFIFHEEIEGLANKIQHCVRTAQNLKSLASNMKLLNSTGAINLIVEAELMCNDGAISKSFLSDPLKQIRQAKNQIKFTIELNPSTHEANFNAQVQIIAELFQIIMISSQLKGGQINCPIALSIADKTLERTVEKLEQLQETDQHAQGHQCTIERMILNDKDEVYAMVYISSQGDKMPLIAYCPNNKTCYINSSEKDSLLLRQTSKYIGNIAPLGQVINFAQDCTKIANTMQTQDLKPVIISKTKTEEQDLNITAHNTTEEEPAEQNNMELEPTEADKYDTEYSTAEEELSPANLNDTSATQTQPSKDQSQAK